MCVQVDNLATGPFHGVVFILSPLLCTKEEEDVAGLIDLGGGSVVADRSECSSTDQVVVVYPATPSKVELQVINIWSHT
jgi:BRCT domain type II-containing protein